MKQRLIDTLFIFLLLLGLAPGWAQPTYAQTAKAAHMPRARLIPADYVAGEILVRFRPGITPQTVNNQVTVGAAALDSLLRQYGVTAADPLFPDTPPTTQGLERIYKLALAPEADLLTFLADLSAQEAIEYAEPNYLYQTLGFQDHSPDPYLDDPTIFASGTLTDSGRIPTDTLFAYQWGLHNVRNIGSDIQAPAAWNTMTGTNTIMIAVIDSGVDYKHVDLDDGRVRTDIDRDFINKDNDAMDDNGHGTHVAGTIAAETNNGIGVAGVMWQAQILPLKVCDDGGSCSTDRIVTAIRYAADQGARVINMSLGGGSCSDTLEAAIDYAYFDKGVVIVAAAGNSDGSVGYPAKYEPVLAVGALDRHGKRAYFSDSGDALDISAPGVRVFSTVPNQGYDSFSGTSMASPHVAGVAGLLLAQRPTLTNHQVRAILLATATDLGSVGLDRYYGHGLVNAAQSLQMATPADAPVPDISRCVEEDCSSEATVAGEPDAGELLTNLRAVRDAIFSQETGQRWTTIYYDHQAEVFWRVLADAELRTNALAAMRSLNPALESLLRPEAAATPVTREMVARVEAVVLALTDQGSPALRADLLREWQQLAPARFVGQDVRSAWQQIETEPLPGPVYLPLMRR